jgi:hypothetical protein
MDLVSVRPWFVLKRKCTPYVVPATPPDSHVTSSAAWTLLVFVLIEPADAVIPVSAVTVTDVTCSPGSSQGLINCVGGGERSTPKSRVADGSLKNVGVTGGNAIAYPLVGIRVIAHDKRAGGNARRDVRADGGRCAA